MDDLVPTLLLIGVLLIMPKRRPGLCISTTLVTLGFGAILVSYLWWRLTETVLPANAFSVGALFVWTVFLCELWLWYETLQVGLILIRQVDRRDEADRHEARLRRTDPSHLPAVDVMIATYNEPEDVLEKTIAGALALDWPPNNLNIYVLDDGRRGWLEAYCRARGVGYLTRDDNRHAKAGNLNAAFRRSSAPFILVLDADFVPQRRMLMRAIGFFEDPKIGIVQMPHHFFNETPLQANLDMRTSLPDEQRFFFDAIMPGRDGWNCAFCCGSNGIIRRDALDAIGGEMPTDSITEDMLLTLVMLRKGYITRYLNERLAVGLAPETLDAYFVQRGRWAQGGIQLLFTPKGPFGPGLSLIQRVMFNPSHWLSLAFCKPFAMAVPALFLLTGAPPLVGADLGEVFRYQVPAILGAYGFMHFLAPRQFAPVAATVEGVLQSFRLLPLVLITLIKPHGHGFKVTPKGSAAGLSREDRFTILAALGLILATGAGLFVNIDFAYRIVETHELLPVVAFWSIFNMFILLIVMTMAVPRPSARGEERFALREPCLIYRRREQIAAETVDFSMSGLLVVPDGHADGLAQYDWVGIAIGEVGIVPGRIIRFPNIDGEPALGIETRLPPGPMRDRFIQKLFTRLPETPSISGNTVSTLRMLLRIFEGSAKALPVRPVPPETSAQIPDWLTRLAEAPDLVPDQSRSA